MLNARGLTLHYGSSQILNGIDLVVVYIPEKFRVFRDICPCAEGAECHGWVLNDLPDRFRRLVSEISPDIGYVDLTPALTAARAERKVPKALFMMPSNGFHSTSGTCL